MFKRICGTRDVSAFVGAGSAAVGTSEGTPELLAKLPCNKYMCNLRYLSFSFHRNILCTKHKRKVRHIEEKYKNYMKR